MLGLTGGINGAHLFGVFHVRSYMCGIKYSRKPALGYAKLRCLPPSACVAQSHHIVLITFALLYQSLLHLHKNDRRALSEVIRQRGVSHVALWSTTAQCSVRQHLLSMNPIVLDVQWY